MRDRDMYESLEQWGAWAASENSGINWQPIAAGFKGLLPYGRKIRHQCNDDYGMLIDKCVSTLKKYSPQEYELVVAHFIMGYSLRRIAKLKNCSDGTIRKEIQAAVSFIAGVMSMITHK